MIPPTMIRNLALVPLAFLLANFSMASAFAQACSSDPNCKFDQYCAATECCTRLSESSSQPISCDASNCDRPNFFARDCKNRDTGCKCHDHPAKKKCLRLFPALQVFVVMIPVWSTIPIDNCVCWGSVNCRRGRRVAGPCPAV